MRKTIVKRLLVTRFEDVNIFSDSFTTGYIAGLNKIKAGYRNAKDPKAYIAGFVEGSLERQINEGCNQEPKTYYTVTIQEYEKES